MRSNIKKFFLLKNIIIIKKNYLCSHFFHIFFIHLFLTIERMNFTVLNHTVSKNLEQDQILSSIKEISNLLDKKFEIFIFNGIFDLRDGPFSAQKWIEALYKKKGETSQDIKGNLISKGNETIGYLKKIGNIIFFSVFGTGHLVPSSELIHSKKIMDLFINNKLSKFGKEKKYDLPKEVSSKRLNFNFNYSIYPKKWIHLIILLNEDTVIFFHKNKEDKNCMKIVISEKNFVPNDKIFYKGELKKKLIGIFITGFKEYYLSIENTGFNKKSSFFITRKKQNLNQKYSYIQNPIFIFVFLLISLLFLFISIMNFSKKNKKILIKLNEEEEIEEFNKNRMF